MATREKRALRVGIDAHGFTSPAAGVRRYVVELVSALRRVSPGTIVLAIGVDETTARTLPHGVLPVAAGPSLPTNAGWSCTGLPLASRRAHLDVLHAPAYTAPLAGAPPVVLTIHDVSYARRPEDYPHRIDPLRRWFYRASARRAAAILTDSGFSRGEIVAAYGIPAERITVVPLGVDPRFAPLAGSPRQKTDAAPYVVHVGDLHARRRPELIVDAILLARRRHDALARLSVVFIGVDRGPGAGLIARAVDAGVPDAVRLLGVVPDGTLVECLQRARALVYASRYEGFGLPLLEAMACGTPVVAMGEASIPEVVGDAAWLVQDGTPARFADAVAAVLLDEAEAARLAAAGLARARSFTWERTAEATLEVYARVAREARRR